MTKVEYIPGPALVLLDCDSLTYAQYIGSRRMYAVAAETPLRASDVEEFRVNPRGFLLEAGLVA
jgi:hypothetical protein